MLRAMLLCALACTAVWGAPVATAATACPKITGFDEYLSRVPGVIVGDMHGTVEAPAFVNALICNLSRAGRPVVVGLEYPSAQQHFIDDFLQDTRDTPHPALLSTPFWIQTKDGRASRAMFNLLSSIRAAKRAGAQIRVVAFDAWTANHLSGVAVFNARDKAMADYLRHALSTVGADEVPIVFTGNVHARKIRGLQASGAPPGMEEAEPLGYRLRDLGFLHMNIDMRAGGSIWTCYSPSRCSVQIIGTRGKSVHTFAILPSEDHAYDVRYAVGPLTVSPPAAASP